MAQFTLDPNHLISSQADLRAMFPPTHEVAINKVLDHVDKHARDFIARSPFMCIGSQNTDGTADVSPRGDPAGFVAILDDRTLAIPDRPGNNRLDTLSNIVANPHVGLMFMIPGFDETMRVNGTARLSTDSAILDRLVVQGKAPKLAIIVSIDEVYLHCAKALRRARLWDAGSQQDRKTYPSLMQVVNDQLGTPAATPDAQRNQDAALEDEYQQTMY